MCLIPCGGAGPGEACRTALGTSGGPMGGLGHLGTCLALEGSSQLGSGVLERAASLTVSTHSPRKSNVPHRSGQTHLGLATGLSSIYHREAGAGALALPQPEREESGSPQDPCRRLAVSPSAPQPRSPSLGGQCPSFKGSWLGTAHGDHGPRGAVVSWGCGQGAADMQHEAGKGDLNTPPGRPGRAFLPVSSGLTCKLGHLRIFHLKQQLIVDLGNQPETHSPGCQPVRGPTRSVRTPAVGHCCLPSEGRHRGVYSGHMVAQGIGGEVAQRGVGGPTGPAAWATTGWPPRRGTAGGQPRQLQKRQV